MDRTHIQADVGVLIGRFQVDKLHPGHLELILWVCGQHKKVVILLGVPQVPTQRENPLDYQARSMMLHSLMAQIPITFSVAPLPDCRTDQQWSTNLDNTLKLLLTPGQSAILYGSRDSFIKHYTGHYPTQELTGAQELWSGTQVRNNIRQTVRPTEDFRAGVIWATHNQYPKTIPTVDTLVTHHGKWLLVRKPNEQGYRFVGGFADPHDPSYEATAIREVKEETNLIITNPKYLFSTHIDDWRYQGTDAITTLFFKAESATDTPTLGDDLAGGGYCWFHPAEIIQNMLEPVHQVLYSKALHVLDA